MKSVMETIKTIQRVLIQGLQEIQQYLYAEQSIAVAVILIVLGSLTGMFLYHFVVINYKNFRVKRTFKSGRIAENAAVKFLRSHGYTILASQLREDVTIYVDDDAETSIVRADYLVRCGWKLYVVEVKSGQQGNAKLPAIRRQLLEYYMVYQPDGILLLDMQNKNLQKIRFAYAGDKKHHRCFSIILCAVAILLIAVIITAVLVAAGMLHW